MRTRCIRLAVLAILAVLLPAPAVADRHSDAKAQVAFGIRVAQAGLWKEARFRFERAIELDPSYAAAWNNLAIVCEQIGDHDKARKAYQQALKLAPRDVFVQQNYEMFKEIHDRMTKAPCGQPPC